MRQTHTRHGGGTVGYIDSKVACHEQRKIRSKTLQESRFWRFTHRHNTPERCGRQRAYGQTRKAAMFIAWRVNVASVRQTKSFTATARIEPATSRLQVLRVATTLSASWIFKNLLVLLTGIHRRVGKNMTLATPSHIQWGRPKVQDATKLYFVASIASTAHDLLQRTTLLWYNFHPIREMKSGHFTVTKCTPSKVLASGDTNASMEESTFFASL